MVLVIDPQIAGISGDMMLCALVDIGADKTKIINSIKSCVLAGSTIQNIDFKRNNKNGIDSVQLLLQVTENTQKRAGSDIQRAIITLVDKLELSDKAKLFAKSCIESLIDSEAKIHGISKDSVHFHEASSIDTVIDIVGVAVAMDDLDLFGEEIVCMPIAVGSGTITFSHGIMSNPASAILEILGNSNLVICGSSIKDELTTPTGACILKNMVTTVRDYYPHMRIKKIGYGSGKKNFEAFPNVLKIVRGDSKQIPNMESVKILETNIDDVSGEMLGSLIENIMKQKAKDVSIYSGITKKNRPTNLIQILCDESSMSSIMDTLIESTGTLGIRINNMERFVLPRTIHQITINIDGKKFDIRYKTTSHKEKIYLKIEFDDIQKTSQHLNKSLKETEYLIRREIEKHGNKNGQT